MHRGQLGPEAQRLCELANDEHGRKRTDVTLASILQEHPDLVAGLDEYVTFMEDHSRQIGKTDEVPPVAHPTSAILSAVLAEKTRPSQ